MQVMLAIRLVRRPFRSPRRPKKTAPSGRTTNAEPNTSRVFSRPMTGSSPGKKTIASVAAT
jgi:hypothetical protein